MRYPDLAAWLERHAELDRRWLEAWCAAPELDAAGFREALGSLSSALLLHVAQEEAWLLPAWARVPDPPPNATAAVLDRDHALLRSLLDEAHALASSRVGRAAALHRLREVLEHHDLREASSIKPALDRLLPREEVEAGLRRIEAEEDALPPPFRFAPRGRTVPEGPEPEDAVAADALVGPALAGLAVPDHPKGPRLHARLRSLAAEVDALEDPRLRRARLADVWRALRLVRIASGERDGAA